MASTVLVAALFAAIAGVGEAAAPSQVVLERMRERVRALRPDLGATIEQGRLSLGGGEIRIGANLEAVLRDGTDWIVDVRVRVVIRGELPGDFEHSVVGIGDDQVAAERSAADDWVGSVGFALLNAQAGQGSASSIGGYEVYAGLPGSRGVVPVGWTDGSDPGHARIIAALSPIFSEAAHGGWATLSLLFMRGGLTGASVDCHVDGSRSETCQQALLDVAWPQGSDFDMLKQTYVIRRVRPNGRSGCPEPLRGE